MKEDLRHYLRDARASMLWKLDDLGERDIRRPLTRTGTNLLGLVKHLTTVESLYFGIVFDRPPTNPVPWLRPDLEPNSDLWATAEESRDYIVGVYHDACWHADATIEELGLDAVGTVAWWPEQQATLHRVLAHVVAETQRHLGHADIVRELIDGAVGLRRGEDFMAPRDEQWWQDRLNQLEAVADNA